MTQPETAPLSIMCVISGKVRLADNSARVVDPSDCERVRSVILEQFPNAQASVSISSTRTGPPTVVWAWVDRDRDRGGWSRWVEMAEDSVLTERVNRIVAETLGWLPKPAYGNSLNVAPPVLWPPAEELPKSQRGWKTYRERQLAACEDLRAALGGATGDAVDLIDQAAAVLRASTGRILELEKQVKQLMSFGDAIMQPHYTIPISQLVRAARAAWDTPSSATPWEDRVSELRTLATPENWATVVNQAEVDLGVFLLLLRILPAGWGLDEEQEQFVSESLIVDTRDRSIMVSGDHRAILSDEFLVGRMLLACWIFSKSNARPR